MSFDDQYSNKGIEIVASGNKIIYAGLVRKNFRYWLPGILIVTSFITAFSISGYFFFQQPFEDRFEYLVSPLTAIAAVWAGFNGRQLLFLPAFFLGVVWSVAAAVSHSVSFNVAAYVFSYCCTIATLLITQLLRDL